MSVTVKSKPLVKQYSLIESTFLKEDNKADVEFLQIQAPSVPAVELVLVRHV